MSDKNHGKKIAADQRRFVEMNLHLLPRGEKVAAAQVMGGPGAAALSAQFSAERGVPSPFVADLGGGADFMQYPRPRGGAVAVRSRSGSGQGFKLAAQDAGRPLTAADRAEIKKKNFAIPESRKYPIHDASHARSALSMVAKHGTPEEQARVRAAVAKKWPGIGSAPQKTASKEPRHTRIEDALDNVGLGLLAAPYVASGLNKHLSHRPGALGAIGRGAGAVEHYIHKKIPNRQEVLGLALVAPGIIKPIAKRIDKALPKEKQATLADLNSNQLVALEKVAMQYIPDFEYMTEAEKLASLAGLLGRAAGTTVNLSQRAVNLGQRAVAGTGAAIGRARKSVGDAAAATRAWGSKQVSDARDAYAAARHAGRIQGVQRARDFNVEYAKGVGNAPVAPRYTGLASTNDRRQRILEQRQALESFRKSKGLGTSAERATAARAAKAPAAAPAPAQLPSPPQAPVAAPAPASIAAPQPAVAQRPAVNPELQARLDSYRASARPTPVPAVAPAPAASQPPAQRVLPQPNARGRGAQGNNPYAWGRGGTQADTGIPHLAALGLGAGAAALMNQQQEKAAGLKLAAWPQKAPAALSEKMQGYARPAPGFLEGLLGSNEATNKTRNTRSYTSGTVGVPRPQRPGWVARLRGAKTPAAVPAGILPANKRKAVQRAVEAAKSTGPLLSGKTIAKAGLIGTLGLGLYAGKKAIDAASDLASGHRHIEPAPSPDYTSVVQ